MRRWELEDLVDYVRGVANPEQRAAIEADLASDQGGVGPLGEPEGLGPDLALLREIRAAVRPAEPEAGPSEDLVAGLSGMPAAAMADVDPALPILPLLRVHDPNAGLYSGYRSAQLGHKDLEIHARRFDLELSIDTPFDAIDVVVVGRLTPGEAERWSVERVPAILVAGGQVLATAVTNRFGEFHVATQSEEDDVELCMLIEGVGQIRIPIDRSEPRPPSRS